MHVDIFVIGETGRLLDTFTSPAVPRIGDTITLAADKGGSQVVRRVAWNVPASKDEHPSVLVSVGSTATTPTPAPPPTSMPTPPPPPPAPPHPDDPPSAPGRSTIHNDAMIADERYGWRDSHPACPDPARCDCICPCCLERWERMGEPGPPKEN